MVAWPASVCLSHPDEEESRSPDVTQHMRPHVRLAATTAKHSVLLGVKVYLLSKFEHPYIFLQIYKKIHQMLFRYMFGHNL